MAELLINKPVDISTGLTDRPKPSTTALTRAERIEEVMASPLRGGPAARGLDIDLDKYRPYIGHVNIMGDIEESRAQNQSVGEQIAFGTGRFIGSTATKLFQGLGYTATALPALFSWDIDVMIDNGFSSMFANAEEYMKEELVPIYHTNKYKEGNVFQQMLTFSFWADDVVDGAAFMMSNLIGAAGIGALGKGLGAYGKLAKTFSSMSRAAKTGQAIEGAANFTKWASTMDLVTMSAYNSVTEAAFEAKDLKDSLLRQGLSNDEASLAAKNAFWSNVTILMGPNMITNSMIFKPFKASKGSVNKLFKNGKFVKENLKDYTFQDAAGAFIEKAAISMASEGLWEENIQLAIQNYETNRALGTDDRNRFKGLMEEWAGNFTTDEGRKAMVLGAIIGLLPGGIGGMKAAKGEREQAQEIHQAMESTLDAYQGRLNSFYIMKEEGSEEFALGKDGKPMLNLPLIKQLWEANVNSAANVGNSVIASEAGNEVFYNFLMEERLSNIAQAYMGLPDGDVLFKAQLETLLEKELDVIEKTGNYELEEDTRNLFAKHEAKVDQYKDMHDAIVNNYTLGVDFGTDPNAGTAKNELNGDLFRESVNQNYWQGVKRDVEAEISKAAGSKMGESTLNKAEIARKTKQLEDIKGLIQQSERKFRFLLSKKGQDALWQKYKPAEEDALVELDMPVRDNEGNASKYIYKEGNEYTFEKDDEGNLEKLSEKEVKLRGIRDAQGNLIVEPDVILDEGGNEHTLEGKIGNKYLVKDSQSGETFELTEKEVKTFKFKNKDLGTLEEEIIQRDKRRVELLAEKYDAIKDKLSTKSGKAARLALDKELIDQLSTHKYDNLKFREVFDKDGITGSIPVIHRGVMGDLTMSPNGKKIVFTPYNGSKEVKFTPDSKRTLAQNAIFVYSNYTFDMELGSDGRTIIVNGTMLANYHNNPLNAIRKDDNGNPIGIRLWKGNRFIYIKNPAIVADLAVAIPMLEAARAALLDHIKESRESFVMVRDPNSRRGREYRVYLKQGEYVVADGKTGKRYEGVLAARVLDAFFEGLQGRMERFTELTKQQTSKEDIKNELREFDNIIRQATPAEINESKSAAEVQGADPETAEAERLPDEPESAADVADVITAVPEKVEDSKELVKQIQEINRDRNSDLARIIRNDEKGPINAKYDAKIEALREAQVEEQPEAQAEPGEDLRNEMPDFNEPSEIKSLEKRRLKVLESIEYVEEYGLGAELKYWINKVAYLTDKQIARNKELAGSDKVKAGLRVTGDTKQEVEAEVNALFDKELETAKLKDKMPDFNEPSEVEAGEKAEEEIIEEKAKEAAEQAADAQLNQEEQEAQEGPLEADTALEPINDDELPDESKRAQDSDDRAGVDPSNTIAYNYQRMPKFNAWISKLTNKIDSHEAHFAIDYDSDDYVKGFWAKRLKAKEVLQNKNSTPEEIKAVLAMDNYKKTTNLIDRIPIKVIIQDRTGKVVEGEILHLHETSFKTSGARDRTGREMGDVRLLRSKILDGVLKGNSPRITNLSKTKGKANNKVIIKGQSYEERNALITSVFKAEAKDIKLGVGKTNGKIERADGSAMPGSGNPGNIFMETRETSNGGLGTVKLNVSKIAKEHAVILLEALIQGHTTGKGYAAVYKGKNVKGLTNGEVIDMIALEGEDLTSDAKRSVSIPHLVDKQLWVDSSKVIHYGTHLMRIHGSTTLEQNDFYQWAMKHKNYNIPHKMLKEVFRLDIKLGSFTAAEGSRYETFVVANGLVKTDLEADMPFTAPVIMFDNSTLLGKKDSDIKNEDSSSKEKVVSKKKNVVTKKVTTRKEVTRTFNKAFQFADLPVGTIIYNTVTEIVKEAPEDSSAADEVKEVTTEWFKVVEYEGTRELLSLPATGTDTYKKIKDFESTKVEDKAQLEKLLLKFGPGRKLKAVFEKTVITEEEVEVTKKEVVKEDAKIPTLMTIKVELEGLSIDELKNVSKQLRQKAVDARDAEKAGKTVLGGSASVQTDYLELKKYIGALMSPDTQASGRSVNAADRFNLLRRKPAGLKNYEHINAKKATKWLRRRLPKGDIKWFDQLIEVGDVVAFGQFTKDSIILSEKAEAGTEYHEAFHRISFGFLTDATRKALYEEARKKYDLKKETDLEVEEFLAEKFREYVIVKNKESWIKRTGKLIAQLFRRMLNFFNINNRQDPKDIESVFAAINEGYFKGNKLLADNEYVNSPRTFLSDIYGFSATQISDIVKGITHLAIKESGVEKLADVPNLDFEIVRKEFDEYYDDLIIDGNTELAAKYMEVLETFDYWVELSESYLRSFKIGKKLVAEVAGENVDNETGGALEVVPDAAQSDFAKLGLAAYESNFKDSVLASIKMLIMLLPESNAADTYLELPAFVDFNSLWNKIMSDLHDKDTIVEMIKELQSKSEGNVAYTKLVEKLLAGDESLRTQFEVSVKRAKHKFVDLLFTYENGIPVFRFQDTDTQRATKKLVEDWSRKFYDSNFFSKQKINKDKVEAVIKQYRAVNDRVAIDYDAHGKIEDFDKALFDTVKLLNTLSINVDKEVITDILASKEINIHEALKSFLQDDLEFLFSPNSVIMRRFKGTVRNTSGDKVDETKLFTDEKVVEMIAESYLNTKPEELSVTVLGPDGNPYFIYAPNNYVTDTIRKFKKDRKHIKTMLDTANVKNSYILNQLYNNADTLKAFDIKTFSGFIQKDAGDVGRDYLNLNEAEDFLFKLSAIHKGFRYKNNKKGYLPMPTLADRKTYYLYDGIDILDYRLTPDANDRLVAVENSEVIKVFKGYAEDEVNRIKLVKKQIETAIKTGKSSKLYEGLHYVLYNDADAAPLIAGKGAKFQRIDKDIVKVFIDNKGNYLGNGAKFHHFRGYDAKNADKFIGDSIDHLVEDTIKFASENGIIRTREENGRTIILENLLLDKNLITTVAKEFNGNRTQAIRRILANYAVNTFMATVETEKMLSGDVASYKGKNTKEINEDKIKRSTVLTSTGDNLRIEFPEGHELHNKPTYNVVTLNTSTIRSEYYEGMLAKHIEIIKAEYEARDKSISDSGATELAKVRLGSYLNVDQTDAQVYLSPTMYRSLLIRVGEWNDLKQEAFDLLKSDTVPSLEDERKALNLLMPPLKFVHYGLYTEGGLSVPIFDKMSMAPLFKSFVKDTNLQDLYNRMEKEGKYKNTDMDKVDMVKFDTVTKVGNTERVNYYADKNPTTVRDMVKNRLVVTPQKFENLRRQLLTDPHDVEKSLFGTQVKKLGMSNVLRGENYKIGDDTKTGTEMLEEWTELLKDFSNTGRETVLKKLGVSRENDDAPYKITDPKKLMKMLREDAIASGMTDNIVKALHVDVNDELYMTIDALPERKWIYSRLISLIGKHTVDVELPGNAFIQMTNFGLDKMTDAEVDVKRLGIDWIDDNDINRSRPLNFYGLDEQEGGVTPMECFVSINLFKRVIPNYKNLTWKQKKAWIKEHPEILGWRIPTQGLNSIAHLKVVGLLPEQLGDTIILPAEFTSLTGADFDIDKLFVARYNYDSNGKEIKFKSGEKNSKKAKENRLLDMYKAVITSKHHYTQVTTPLDSHTELVKEIYRDVVELNGEDSQVHRALYEGSPRYQSEVKKKYTKGKDGISPFALNNAHHPLGQIAGLALKETKGGMSGYIGVGNFTEIEGKKVTDLSQIQDTNGINILDWLSALINAHVDVAKDPYILSLNVNAKTYGVTNLLIRSGAGAITFKFLPQPILVALSKEAAIQKGKIISVEGSAGTLVRSRYVDLYEAALKAEGKKFKEAGGTEKELDISVMEESKFAGEEVWDINRLDKDIKLGREGVEKNSKFYERQLQILDTYERLNVHASSLNEVVMVSQIDTKKYGSNLSEIVGFMNRYKQMWDKDALHNTDKLFKDTFLDTLYQNSVLLSKEVFGQLTITGTKQFQDVVTRILDITGNGYTIDKKFINHVADELFTAISSGYFVNEMGATPAKIEKLFYGENGVVAQVDLIKSGKLYPDLQDNRILSLLKTDLDIVENKFHRMTLHSTNIKEKWDRDELVRSWSDLLDYRHENAETQEGVRSLGRNIIMYAFYASGFNKTLTSFYEFIPNDWLKYYRGKDHAHVSYATYMNNVLKSFKNNGGLGILTEAMDDIFVNNWAREKKTPGFTTRPLIPKVDTKDMDRTFYVDTKRRKATLFQMKYSIKAPNYVGTTIDGDPIYNPYTLYNDKLFKYIGYDNETKNGIYKIVPTKKGFYEKGFVLKEYLLDKSIISSNDSGISKSDLELTDEVIRGESWDRKNDTYRDIELMSINKMAVHERKGDAMKTSATQSPKTTEPSEIGFGTFEDFRSDFLKDEATLTGLSIDLSMDERRAARRNILEGKMHYKQAQDLNNYLEVAYDSGTLDLIYQPAGGKTTRVGKTIKKIALVEHYTGDIKPDADTIMVFGSNPIGVNGNPRTGTGGAALVAQQQFGVKAGEIMDNTISSSGSAYGLTTVTKPGRPLSISKEDITSNISMLYAAARQNPDKQFKVAYRNTGTVSLNGYTGYQMIEMFNDAGVHPSNIVFSEEWAKTGLLRDSRPSPKRVTENPTEYTNHSGGAVGSDTQWDQIGATYGMTSNKHYYHGTKTPSGNIAITEAEFVEGKEKVRLANKTLDRRPEKYMDLLARNWMQVKNADAVFAIGTINFSDATVKGGTGWAVQMALDSQKPVHMFDQVENSWYEAVYADGEFQYFESAGTPTLTKNFAGIGTREINSNGKQAIKDVYNNTFEKQTESPFRDTTSKADVPQNLISGKEAFGTKQIATNFVQGVLGSSPHSIDMVAAGLRTRTTRSAKELEKYNLQPGDSFTHVGKSADGTIKRVKAYVIDIYPKGSKEYTSTWYKEGWTPEGVEAIKRFKDGAAAIEFALEPDVIFDTEQPDVRQILDAKGKSFSELTVEEQQELRDKYKHCK